MAMGRARVGGAKKMICAGSNHSLVTSGKEGMIWSFGCGGFCRLGHGGTGSEAVPRLIEALNLMVVKQVAAGSSHSMVLTSDGDAFTWGYGFHGQLGHGNRGNQLVPKRVEGLTNVMDIAAGDACSLAVVDAGSVYTWGFNYCGQLGLGDHGGGTNRNVPTEVPGLNEVVAVAAGFAHSVALSRDGTAMACGDNDYGQLGLGDTVQRDTFTVVAGLRVVVDIDAGYGHTIAATAEGGLYTWGTGRAIGHGGNDLTQRLVPTKVTGGGIDDAMVVQVAAGDYHSMAKTASGELYAWGVGNRGQLGHGGKESFAVPRVVDGIGGPVVGMSGGNTHSLVTTAEGRVLVFGYGGDARLGLGAGVEEALTPTAIDGITLGEDEGKEGKE
jgi:alpha-tubulin suppressor-like RCC1 family protein